MNLLKALDGLSAAQKSDGAPKTEEQKPQPAPAVNEEAYNAMAGVLERHEQIANRVRNKR